jgi:hypothetical protein
VQSYMAPSGPLSGHRDYTMEKAISLLRTARDQ